MSLHKVAGCCLVLLALLVGCEAESTSFATVGEAREAGLYVRGWAPDVLPEEAGPIEEVHDLDTNARCLTAAVPSSAVASVRSALAREGFASRAVGADRQPESFCPFSADELADIQLLYRESDGGGVEYAALSESDVFYYWSAGDASK